MVSARVQLLDWKKVTDRHEKHANMFTEILKWTCLQHSQTENWQQEGATHHHQLLPNVHRGTEGNVAYHAFVLPKGS